MRFIKYLFCFNKKSNQRNDLSVELYKKYNTILDKYVEFLSLSEKIEERFKKIEEVVFPPKKRKSRLKKNA